MVNAFAPWFLLDGLRLDSFGAGTLVIVKVSPFEARDPGLTTVTVAVPATVTTEAGTVAVIFVPETNEVVSGDPFQLTVAPLTKPDPFTVSVNEADPAVTDDGLKLVIEGCPIMVNVAEFDSAEPGFEAVIVAAPDVAILAAGTDAVTEVEETKLVTSAEPFQFTTAPEAKPVPLTVRVKPEPPAEAEAGLRPVITGGGGPELD